MNNNLMNTRQNLWYVLFVPHREQHNFCDEKDHLAVVSNDVSAHEYQIII
jgi:hypothetical protein